MLTLMSLAFILCTKLILNQVMIMYVDKCSKLKWKRCKFIIQSCTKIRVIKHTVDYEVNSPFRYTSNNNNGLHARTATDHYTIVVSFEKKVSV